MRKGKIVDASIRADLRSILFPIIPLTILACVIILQIQRFFKAVLGFHVPAPLWAMLMLIIFCGIVRKYRKRSR